MLIYLDPTSPLTQSREVEGAKKTSVALGRRYRPLLATPNSPEGLVATLYRNAVTLTARQACLNYLLQYQHYNADFTITECEQLGYPIPLFAPQKLSGYARTEYIRFAELTKSWITHFVSPLLVKGFKAGNNPVDFIKLSSIDVVDAIRFAYSNEIELITVSEWCAEPISDLEKRRIVVIPIDISEINERTTGEILLKTRLEALANKKSIGSLRLKDPKARFLFVLKMPEASSSVIWGAVWESYKKNNGLRCNQLQDPDFFGNSLFSQLNQLGAVPDRIGLNRMITFMLGEGDWHHDRQIIGDIKSTPISVAAFNPQKYIAIWEQFIQSLETCDFTDDPGCEIYRQAVIRWNTVFIKTYGLTEELAPLLCEQVVPWMNPQGTLLQWSKGNQNLCEIVTFALQSYPERFLELDFEEAVRSQVFEKEQNPLISAHMTLLPYGMAAATVVLENLIRQNRNPETPLTISCISQHYFETLLVLSKQEEIGSLAKSQYDSIEEIPACPDILITDFHPNNAARKKLFPNRVAEWVFEELQKDPNKQLKLILDITLNHFSDEVVRKTISMLEPFIEKGRLEIYFIQSLAKLVQLGADNFSGGLLLHLAGIHEQNANIIFPSDLPERKNYFTLLLRNFSDISKGYFQLVRSNTDTVYRELSINFTEIKKHVSIQGQLKGFCAVEVTLNSDESTCYVALSFSPFLDQLKIEGEYREKLSNRLRQLLLEIAGLRELPITGRQSFGFTLSNMSEVCEAIRFSIGIENKKHLKKNCEMIVEFVEMLSIYVAKKHNDFNENLLFEGIRMSFGIIPCNNKLASIQFPMFKEHLGKRTPSPWGIATLSAEKGKVSVHAIITETNQERIFSEDQLAHRYRDVVVNEKWSKHNSVMLLFRILTLDPKEIDLRFEEGHERCLISGVTINFFPLNSYDDSRESDEQYHVEFTPEFRITLDNGLIYTNDKIITQINSFGPIPVKISRLNGEDLTNFYQRCVRWVWSAEETEDGLLKLTFIKEKPSRDYMEWIYRIINEGSIEDLFSELDSINPKELPISDEHLWIHPETGEEALIKYLAQVGEQFATRIQKRHLELLLSIRHEPFYYALVEGMLEAALNPKIKLSAYRASLCAYIFEAKPPLRYEEDDRFDEGLYRILCYLKKHPSRADNCNNHLVALEPVLLDLFKDESELLSQYSSSDLKELAVTLQNFTFSEHLYNLEDALIERAKSISSPEEFHSYCKFFLKYPWDAYKEDLFLIALSKCPRPILETWVSSFEGILHVDIPWENQFWLALGDFKLKVGENNREKLRTFFTKTGLIYILYGLAVKNPMSHKMKLLQWGISLQDELLTQFLCVAFDSKLPLLEQLDNFENARKTLGEDFKAPFNFKDFTY